MKEMKIYLEKDSKHRTRRTKYRDVADQGTVIGDIDEGQVFLCGTRIAANQMVWRIPFAWRYDIYDIYYEGNIPVIEFTQIKE